jgi:predicted Zn-dependent peptidase
MHNITKLSNKFQVATQTMNETETVAISLWVKVGSRYETIEQNGISHFLEHMAFKGTKKRTALDIAKEFDDIGGQFNACTGREHTIYYTKLCLRIKRN